jgi:chitin synthase
LESFGHAHTLSSDNASRFGNYTELQFSDSGKLEGLKTIEYYLERSRASHPPSVGERNFHVFYYLVSGIHGEERNHLKLRDVYDYRYLQSRVRRSGPTDQHRFDQLKQAFRVVGLSTSLVAQICQLLAVILHIGNLQFHKGHGSGEGSVATSGELLDVVADFLGVTTEAMAELFAVKTMLVRKEVCTSFLEPEEAETVRDELARTLYSLLFSWLNEHLNQKLCKDSFGSFIAILDLPGPQSKHGSAGEINSLDQFCFNIANEKVYNWVLQRIHVVTSEEAQQDNLPIARLPFFDNTECVNLLGASKGGLINIMDDHARKRKTASSMVDAMGKRHGGHSSFTLDPTSAHGGRSFTINHYSGPVSYSAENFLEQNANETSADVLRLLRGDSATVRTANEYEGSNNPFIKSLFSSKAIATRLHPRNEDTIVAVQQSVKPVRAPSTRRKRAPPMQAIIEGDMGEGEPVGGGNDEIAAGQTMQCIAGQHWSAVTTLLETFEHAQAWYIFCVKPNDSHLPSQMDIRAARFQIRSLGITELALRLKGSCEIRMTHAEACDRYREEFTVRGIAQGLPDSQRLADLQRVLRLSDVQMAIGSTRVSLPYLCLPG